VARGAAPLVAVTETFTPPGQPTSGSLTYVPLGGDGYSAPQAAYAVQNHAVTGDASGGRATLSVVMDPRFCSLVSFCSFQIQQGTSADAEYRLTVGSDTGGTQIPPTVESGPVEAVVSLVSSSEINKTSPIVPMMLPGAGQVGRIRYEFLNVDGDVFSMSALIYLFNIRVRELTPMGGLLWARGAT